MSDGPDLEVVKPKESNDALQETAELPNISAVDLLEEGAAQSGNDSPDQSARAASAELVQGGALPELELDGLEDRAAEQRGGQEEINYRHQGRELQGRRDYRQTETDRGDDANEAGQRRGRELQGRRDYRRDDSPSGRLERTFGRPVQRALDRATDSRNIFNGKGEIDPRRAQRNFKSILDDLGRSARGRRR